MKYSVKFNNNIKLDMTGLVVATSEFYIVWASTMKLSISKRLL